MPDTDREIIDAISSREGLLTGGRAFLAFFRDSYSGPVKQVYGYETQILSERPEGCVVLESSYAPYPQEYRLRFYGHFKGKERGCASIGLILPQQDVWSPLMMRVEPSGDFSMEESSLWRTDGMGPRAYLYDETQGELCIC